MRSLLLLLAFLSASGAARAEGGNEAAAEALYQEGRALFDQGKYAEACPRLAESQRIEPATGTLLALALCHEQSGALASAWAEYTDAAGRAHREGRADREQFAVEHGAALKPRLSTLTVTVSPEAAAIAGLEVRVDGAVAGSGSFGVAIPVDGGEHRIEASAPGKQPFQTAVKVKPESDPVRVVIPALGATPPGPAGPPAPADQGEAEPGAGMRLAGLVTAGAGVLALGVGTYLALDAKGDYDSAKEQCGPSGCTQGPHDDIESARGQGTVASVVFAVGGAAVATGAVLWFVAPRASATEVPAAGVRVERLGLSPRGITLGGSF